MKSKKAQSKTLTLRLPPQLYKAAQELAKRREMSLNALMQQSIEESIKSSEERALFEGFTLLGRDLEDSDDDYAIHAQSEVMLNDEA